MNVHEYQAKKLLSDFGVKVPGGQVVFSADEVAEVLDTLNSAKYVVKAQVHAGGRGKGGGIKVVDNAQDATQAADADNRYEPCYPPDGPGGQNRGKRADRGSLQYRKGVLSRHGD